LAKTKVSDVVRRIATEHALVGKVENTAAVRDRWQLRKSDWDFLRSLTYEGASASRRGDTYLWLTGDVINYRAPELAAPSERRHNLDTEEVRVNSTVVSYNGRAIDRAGGATLLGVGYDLELGTALPFLMNAAATATQPALGRFVPRAPAKGTRTIPVFRSSLDLVEEMVRSKWGNYSPRYFSLVLETRPDLSLRPGSIVEVQATVGIKQRLPVFGRYVVLEVMHNMVKADLRTTVVCYRREAFLGADLALGASVSEGKTRDRNQTGQETPKVLIVAEVLDG